MKETTTIETPFGDVVVCDNCGAYNFKGRPIKHYPSCVPGEAEKWANKDMEDSKT